MLIDECGGDIFSGSIIAFRLRSYTMQYETSVYEIKMWLVHQSSRAVDLSIGEDIYLVSHE